MKRRFDKRCGTAARLATLVIGASHVLGCGESQALSGGTHMDLQSNDEVPDDRGGSTGSLIPDEQLSETISVSIASDDATVRLAEQEAPTVDVQINPYTITEADPFSTFAADVDTASYELFRTNLLVAARLPSPDTVRIEEFVNFFEYAYSAPDTEAEHPFQIHLAATSHLFDSPRTLLRVGIQAQQPIATEHRPTNLAFLIDTSGSMQDSLKLPLVKTLLSEALEVLDPSDRVAVVTYGAGTGLALASTPVQKADKIRDVIEGLGASGATNGAQGLEIAYEQVAGNFIEGGINHVVLCTDGDFNVGPSSTTELVELIEDKRKSGITFTAVGFGLTPNDQMMEAISNAGNGTYGAVGSSKQAKDYARDRLLGTLEMVAKDLKIQVEFNPERVYAYRLLGYENRALSDVEFRDDVVDAGEVGAGHRVTALYELALRESDIPEGMAPSQGETSQEPREIDDDALVLVKVRYKDVDATESDAAYEVQESLDASHADAPDLDFEWAGAMAMFAELLRGSPYVDRAALGTIADVVNRQAPRDPLRAEFAELLEMAQPLLKAR